MCRPFHLALLFRLQKRPQGVQQLHGGAVAAAVFLRQRQELSQQRRVQPAQSAKAYRPSARLILRIGGRRRWRLRCDLLCTAHSSGELLSQLHDPGHAAGV